MWGIEGCRYEGVEMMTMMRMMMSRRLMDEGVSVDTALEGFNQKDPPVSGARDRGG